MFAGASNFEIRNSIFTTGNVIHHGAPQPSNHGQVISISNVLQCPAPSPYFVGREDILRKLSKIFSAPAVTLWGTNMDALKDFVRQNLKYSGQALAKSVANLINKSALAQPDVLLVLQSADAPVDSEYLHTLPYAPVLVMTTQPSLTSSASLVFQLPNDANQQVVHKLLHSVERVLNARKHVVTVVANGGTGKTQAVLKFVSENLSRFSNIWFFDASSNDTLTANLKDLGKAAGIGEDVKDVRNLLARINENWLCIFDNADDKNVYLKDYVPICNHGNAADYTGSDTSASDVDPPIKAINFMKEFLSLFEDEDLWEDSVVEMHVHRKLLNVKSM
ncbi:hypothetical protein BT96DRAFT_933777 [Gymnopus androsaceus JB14]|uniref:NB-ARC domain-containing protein n=1 Tax=Gymnopus androsaceus JB14 TaxID=1447944 RepID=A0A6A4IDL1_9AGAR|nr:hypothetical protein BT96DRAFT_933777 [Gymnopus androsaceus JB14]